MGSLINEIEGRETTGYFVCTMREHEVSLRAQRIRRLAFESPNRTIQGDRQDRRQVFSYLFVRAVDGASPAQAGSLNCPSEYRYP